MASVLPDGPFLGNIELNFPSSNAATTLSTRDDVMKFVGDVKALPADIDSLFKENDAKRAKLYIELTNGEFRAVSIDELNRHLEEKKVAELRARSETVVKTCEAILGYVFTIIKALLFGFSVQQLIWMIATKSTTDFYISYLPTAPYYRVVFYICYTLAIMDITLTLTDVNKYHKHRILNPILGFFLLFGFTASLAICNNEAYMYDDYSAKVNNTETIISLSYTYPMFFPNFTSNIRESKVSSWMIGSYMRCITFIIAYLINVYIDINDKRDLEVLKTV